MLVYVRPSNEALLSARVPGGAGAEGHATPPSSYLERINPTPEQFAIHRQMSFRVYAFCEQEGHLAAPYSSSSPDSPLADGIP